MKRLLLALLLLPVTAFATITATDRGTGNSVAAGSSIVISPGSNMAVGSTGVLVLAMDNANGNASNLNATSFTDSVGNVWLVKASGFASGANASAEGQILTAFLTHAFTTSDTLTLNFVASTTSKAWAWTEAVPSAGNTIISVHATWGNTTSTASPTITSLNIAINDLIIGAAASENNTTWTGDADTSNGTWSTIQTDTANTGTLATSIAVGTQSKVVSATATQIFNPTPATVDCRVGWIQLTEADVKVRSVGHGTGTPAEAATVINVARSIAAGSIGVLCLAADNAGANGNTANFPASFSDTQSNTWTLQQTGLYDPAGASAGAEYGIYTSVLTTGLTAGTDTMTVTYTAASVSGKTWVIWEFAPAGGGTMSYVAGASGSGAATASPSVTTSSITSGDYVVGMVAVEGAIGVTGDSDSTNGTWKTQAGTVCLTGTDTADMSITSQWKLTTGTATQTYNISWTGSPATPDTMLGWISIHETTGLTAQRKSAFFMLFP